MRWGGRLSQNLAELSLKKEDMKTDLPDFQAHAGSDFTPVSCGAQVPWGLGRLFGASKSPNSPPGHTPPTRLANDFHTYTDLYIFSSRESNKFNHCSNSKVVFCMNKLYEC